MNTINQIHISKDTYDIVKDKYSFSEKTIIDIKGKGKMETYYLKAKK